MTCVRKKSKLFLLILILFFLQLYCSDIRAQEFAIIVNQSNPVKEMHLRDIRAYFLKEKVFWPTGDGVVPLELTPAAPERAIFLKKVINKSEVELEEYWILRKQTEAQYAPQQISSSKMMIKLVGSLKWAVGYIDRRYLDSEALKKVKIVEIIK